MSQTIQKRLAILENDKRHFPNLCWLFALGFVWPGSPGTSYYRDGKTLSVTCQLSCQIPRKKSHEVKNNESSLNLVTIFYELKLNLCKLQAQWQQVL